MRAFEAPSEARPGRRKTPLVERREARFRANGSDAPSQGVSGRPSPGCPRDAIASIPRFPALRSPQRARGLAAPKPEGRRREYGLPGAAKNTGDDVWLFEI